MRTCAIFDLDGTIINRSSERVFLNYLLSNGEIPLGNLLRWTAYFIKSRNLRESKANKVYLRGLEYEHICAMAQLCVAERLINSISPRVFEHIEFHRAEGRTVIILSGSLEILIRLFHNHLKTDMMIGNVLEVVNGTVTGRRIGRNCYGENKAILVQQIATEHGFDLSQSYAYGNHYSDAHKLHLVGHPVAVNPDGKLRRIAAANGWRIEQFHDKLGFTR
ncbi:MAG: HAD-IB family hydrolase [Candidatus Poribacteria bacterium]|nr:HAD-IB family hydrolase [Candidatus Poribacteria bacterium]